MSPSRTAPTHRPTHDEGHFMDHAQGERSDQTSLLSIVIPIYNEEGNVEPLLESLEAVLRDIGLPYEIVLIDDGSADGTWPLVVAAAERDPHVTGAALSRNFGHQNAIFAGLHLAKGDVIITMDGDLQHPPGLIPELLARWRAGFNIVETQRKESADVPAFKALTSRLFYRAFSVLSGIPMSEGTSDFRLIDRKAADAMRGMRDAELFLRGISHWVGFRRTTVPYQAGPRHSGRTKYSLSRMLRFAGASLLSFSMVPLKFGIWLGLATSVLAFLELIYILVRYFQGDAVPGWASMLTVVSFMFGILFILVGILGAYVGSIFQTVKNRPLFLIEETTRRRLDG
jgi:glycosyltransferase involved in cell wall biosynthesis